MTERDYKILVKILEKQYELADIVKEYKVKRPDDLSKILPVVRRGIIAFIADLFELTKPISEMIQQQLPFNRTFIKSFRDTSTHQYGRVTDTIAHTCLMHCVDKSTVNAIKKLIGDYNKTNISQSEADDRKK